MDKIADGYYFMFEIGWFVDLLIPTLVKIEDENLYLVGSKPCDCKNLKPCCIPAGGEAECKKLSLDDPSLKAFKSIDSLVAINNPDDLEGELDTNLADKSLQEKYFNSPAKKQREAMIDRVMNDYQILSATDSKAK
jgi:hypothetical protein